MALNKKCTGSTKASVDNQSSNFECCDNGQSRRNRRRQIHSLRSKRFCGFSEQGKIEERDFDNFASGEMGAKKWSVGGGGKE